jgi:hypothetical protein
MKNQIMLQWECLGNEYADKLPKKVATIKTKPIKLCKQINNFKYNFITNLILIEKIFTTEQNLQK